MYLSAVFLCASLSLCISRLILLSSASFHSFPAVPFSFSFFNFVLFSLSCKLFVSLCWFRIRFMFYYSSSLF